MNMYRIYIFLAWLIAANVFGQTLHKKDYYSELTLENFRKEKLFQERLNFDSLDYQRIHAAIFFVTNEVRAKKKLSFLAFSPQLEESAMMHSRDMYENKFFSHVNPHSRKKKNPNDRAGLVGISNPYLAENIAENFGLQYEPGVNVYVRGNGKFSYEPEGEIIQPHTYLTFAETLMDSWMKSKGHRKNILSDKALQLGCGVYFYYDKNFNNMPSFKATQNFQWYERIKLKQ